MPALPRSVLSSPVKSPGVSRVMNSYSADAAVSTSRLPEATTKKWVGRSPMSTRTWPACVSKRCPKPSRRAICASVSLGNICARRVSRIGFVIVKPGSSWSLFLPELSRHRMSVVERHHARMRPSLWN